MPGGDTRSGTYYPPYPIAMARGSGHQVWDIDGNQFTDFVNNWGSLIHGHSHPVIVEAITRQASLGTCYAAPTSLQAELAERICGRISSIEKLRFTNSGSEADMIAVRAARAYTGRELVVKASGGFHGSYEQLPKSWQEPHIRINGPVNVEDPGPPAWGAAAVPAGVRDLVEMVEYNDPSSLNALMEERGGEVAAIILEPVLGEGVITGEPEFFGAARAAADRHGALLILDEVQSLRFAPGGYQEVLDVRPDITTLGTVVGGGLPLGVVGGSEELMMGVFDPHRDACLIHGGTYNGNDMAMAAGCACLDLLDSAAIEHLDRMGTLMVEGLRRELADRNVEAVLTRCGSMLHIHFGTSEPVRSVGEVDLGSRLLSAFQAAALDEGVFVTPRGTMYASTPMQESTVEDAVQRLGRAVGRATEADRG